jgi:hypothetical protein
LSVERRFPVRLLALAAGVLAATSAACASRAAFVAPVGPGTPAPDAAAVWSAVVGACRATTAYRAEFGLTGQIGDRRIRGLASARLFAAVSADGRLGLESSVSGQLVFRLGGTSDRAVLLVRDQNRVTTARPDEILEALIGVPIGPARLLAVVTGCVTLDDAIVRAARHDGLLEIETAEATVYVASTGAGWQPRAGRFGQVTVEYFSFQDGLPRSLRIASAGSGKSAVALNLDVRAVQTNGTMDDSLFRVTVPDGASPISLDELRQIGPLAEDAPAR